MAAKAIKHFRLRELARPPPPLAFKPSSTAVAFDSSKFHLSPTPEPDTPTSDLTKRTNPFLPTKNVQTGRWAPPKYSLRRQADLVKKARASGTLALLPPSLKTSAASLAAVRFARAQPIVRKPKADAASEHLVDSNADTSENGNDVGLVERWSQPVEWVGQVRERKVPGAEIGNRLYAGKKRMFKGHKWERVAEKRMLKRRMLMRDMAKRIQRYKQYHKRRRPNPLQPSKKAGGKLPF